MKLWSKNTNDVNTFMEYFTVGIDNQLDSEYFISYDITATKAHAKALCSAGIYTESELQQVLKELSILQDEVNDGVIVVRVEDEDCHTLIERRLTITLGDLGKKIHTGRSRNDQALTMIRLFMLYTLYSDIQVKVDRLQRVFKGLRSEYDDDIFIGYTHTQQAMPITLGHYFDSFREQLQDCSDYITLVGKSMDKNPLGSGAGFGSSVNIDREITTEELAFDDTQVNSLYCQNSRGQYELRYVHVLSQVMFVLQKFASDMILYTSREFGFFDVDSSISTGSSMMPQKKNLDIAELIRANHAMVMGNETQIQTLCHGLVSGYNRDYQLIKNCIVEAFKTTDASLSATLVLLEGLKPNHDAIKSKLNVDMFATDIAINESIVTGKPFRTLYQSILSDIDNIKLSESEMLNLVKKRVTLGSPGNYKSEGDWII